MNQTILMKHNRKIRKTVRSYLMRIYVKYSRQRHYLKLVCQEADVQMMPEEHVSCAIMVRQEKIKIFPIILGK